MLERTIWVPKSIDEVFEFFGAAENLQKLTPDFLSFEILTPTPIEMKKGTLIDYRIKLGIIPMRWRTLISEYNPPTGFVDDQLKGPYLLWHHEHSFEPEGEGTRIHDKVTYKCPGWILEPLIHSLFIEPRLRKIFDYRGRVISEIFIDA